MDACLARRRVVHTLIVSASDVWRMTSRTARRVATRHRIAILTVGRGRDVRRLFATACRGAQSFAFREAHHGTLRLGCLVGFPEQTSVGGPSGAGTCLAQAVTSVWSPGTNHHRTSTLSDSAPLESTPRTPRDAARKRAELRRREPQRQPHGKATTDGERSKTHNRARAKTREL